MTDRINTIYQLVKDAVENGAALEARDIRALRAERKKAVTLLKSVFWIGIAIFNLALWVPLPLDISKPVLYAIAFVALVIGLVAPMFGLKRHHVDLEMLKVSKQVPKKRSASEVGRIYIDQVKKQERPFINAEIDILEGSKWAEKP